MQFVPVVIVRLFSVVIVECIVAAAPIWKFVVSSVYKTIGSKCRSAVKYYSKIPQLHP
jgi:hypothetical protein